MHVEQPLTGSAWAIGVLAFGLIIGAIPVASVGLVLSALTRRDGYQWPSAWRLVFQAGFVVQISGLVPTVPLPGGTNKLEGRPPEQQRDDMQRRVRQNWQALRACSEPEPEG